MLVDWYYCAATRMTKDGTAALLAALDVLDHPDVDDEVIVLAIERLVKDRAGALYSYGRVLHASCARRGVPAVAQAHDRLDDLVTSSAPTSVSKLLSAVRRGASADRIVGRAAEASAEVLKTPGERASSSRSPYAALEEHAGALLILEAARQAASEDPGAAEQLADDAAVGQLIASASSGARGRAALLAAGRLRLQLGEGGKKVANELWLRGGDVASLQPDLLALAAQLRYDPEQSSFDELRKEWLTWPWLAGHRTGQPDSARTQAMARILGVPEASEAVAVVLWQATLSLHAARAWPHEFSELVAPSPTAKGHQTGAWSAPKRNLPDGGRTGADLREDTPESRPLWARTVADLVALRGRDKPSIRHRGGANLEPFTLPARWTAQAFSPWIDRTTDRISWRPLKAKAYGETSTAHLLRFGGSGFAVMELLRRGAGTHGILELFLHVADVLEDKSMDPTDGPRWAATEGPLAGLLERLRAAAKIFGQAYEPALAPDRLVEVVEGETRGGATALRVLTGSRGRQLLTMWATDSLGGSIVGGDAPWEDGTPPLAQRFLYDAATSGPPRGMVQIRAAGSLHVYYPRIVFDRLDWRVDSDRSGASDAVVREWPTYPYTLLCTDRLAPEEWRPSWKEPDNTGLELVRAVERLSSLLGADQADEDLLQQWVDDLVRSCRLVSQPRDLARIVRRRMLTLVDEAHRRGWTEPAVADAIDELIRTVLVFGRGNPGDISTLLAQVAEAASVPDRDRELLRLRVAVLQAAALMPPDDRDASDLRFAAGRAVVAEDLDRRRAAMVLVTGTQLDPVTQQRVPDRALAWWRSAELEGRRHASQRTAADLLAGTRAATAGVRAVALDALGRPTALVTGAVPTGARRTATVSERFHEGRRTLRVEVEGESQALALDGQAERVVDRWDPDLSRSFRARPGSRSWTVVVEHGGRDGWVPVDGGPVELVAALADPEGEQILTLAGRIGGDRLRLVRRPGEAFVIDASVLADPVVRDRLLQSDAGLRVRVVAQLVGELVQLQPQPFPGTDSPFEDLNLRWRERPEDPVALEQRADGAWVWPRSIDPVFPDPEVDIRPTSERLLADLDWRPGDLRRGRTTGTEVAEVEIERSEPPDADRFARLLEIHEGTIVELPSIRYLQGASLSHGRTRDLVPVNVRTESVTMRTEWPSGALTRGRRAVVTQVRRGDGEVLVANLHGDLGWLPDRVEGVVAEVSASSVLAWFDVGTALRRDLQALVLSPDRGTAKARVGDLVRVTGTGGVRRVTRIPRIIRADALWTTRSVERLPRDRGAFLGEISRDGLTRSVFETDRRPELLIGPALDEPLQHLQAGDRRVRSMIGVAPAESRVIGRWQVSVGDASIWGDGPRTGDHGVLTDVSLSLEGAGPGEEVVASRWFSIAPTKGGGRNSDALRDAWAAHLSNPTALTGLRKGDEIHLDDLQVQAADGRWTRTVPLGPDETTPLVTGVGYSATWRVVLEGSPPVASQRRVPDRAIGDLADDEHLDGRKSRRLSQPLYFVEQAPDGSLLFERGFGDRIRVPAAQVRIDGRPIDPAQGVSLFLGDRVREVRVTGRAETAVLHIESTHVAMSVAHRLHHEASKSQVVHLLHLRGTRSGHRVEAVEGLDLRSNLSDGAPSLTQQERRVRAEVTGVIEPLEDGEERTVLGRLNTRHFERTGGRELVFTAVAARFSEGGLRENDIVIVKAGEIEQGNGDWWLHCSLPAEAGRGNRSKTVKISRRSFSSRESLLPFLGKSSTLALAGRSLPVKLKRDRRSSIDGDLRSLPRRQARVLRDLLRLDREDRFAVVNQVLSGSIVLEVDVAVLVELDRHDFAAPRLSRHDLVRCTVGDDDRIHLEPVSSSDHDFAVPNRAVIAFALAQAVNRPTEEGPRDRDLTVGGLSDEFYRAATHPAHVALVTGRHPRIAHISAVGSRNLDVGPGSAAAVKIVPAEDGTVEVKPLGAQAEPAVWPALSVAEVSAPALARWATQARWRYHESQWGDRSDDGPRRWHPLGWRRLASEPVLIPETTRGRLRVAELTAHAFPARELLDRAQRDKAFTAHIAAVVTEGDRSGAPPGIYIETVPGRVVHVPVGLLRTPVEDGSRSLRALDLRLMHEGDRLRLRIHADRPTDVAHLELLSWNGSPTAAWDRHRAVLPVAPDEAANTTRAGVGHFSMLVPASIAGPLAAFRPGGRSETVAETDIRRDDVVLIEVRDDGSLGVCGTSLAAVAVEGEDRPLLRALAEPATQRHLMVAVGGALPVTVIEVADGTVTFGLGAQRFRRPEDEAIGLATVLGPVGGRVLLAFGASLVLVDPQHLLPSVPKARRAAVLDELRSRGQALAVYIDGGRPRIGRVASRSGPVKVRVIAHIPVVDGAGFVAIDEWGAVRWLDQEELCWARVDADGGATLTRSLAKHWLPAWIDDDGATARMGSRLDDLWESLEPGMSLRVVPLEVEPDEGGSGWKAPALLQGQVVVELAGAGPQPPRGEPMATEVRATVRKPRRVVHLVEPGRRPAIWDVPTTVRTWITNRGSGHGGMPRPSAVDRAVRRASGADADRTEARRALANWLEDVGPQLVGVADRAVDLDGVSTLMALQLLRAEVARDSEEARADRSLAELLDLATRAIGWRAARSIHIEALTASWNPRAADPYWKRLKGILPKVDQKGNEATVAAKDARLAAGHLEALRYRLLDGELDQELDICLAALAYATGQLDAVLAIESLEVHAPACAILAGMLRALPEPGVPLGAGTGADAIEAALGVWLEQPDRPWRLLPLGVDPPLDVQARAGRLVSDAVEILRDRCATATATSG